MSGITMPGIAPEGAGRSKASPLKKAIKDYQDKMLSGLTEDERKEIEAKVAEHRKKCMEAGMDPKAIQASCDNYYKSLLREYGAKFTLDFDSALSGAEGEVSAAQGGGETSSEATTDASKSPEANTINKSGIKSEVKTDPDGTVYMIITSPNGINMKIKIGNEGDSEDDLIAGIQMAKNNGVMDYEKNNDAFFEEKSKISFSS